MAGVTTAELQVGQAAARLGVSTDSLRRWEKKGLISVSRDPNGARTFSEDDIIALSRLRDGTNSRPWAVLRAEACDLTVIELFAGAGGLALGMSNAGFQTQDLVDFDPDCIQTLRTNRPEWQATLASVSDLSLSDRKGEIDVLAGGFPCQAFSYAGLKRGFEDTRGTLFYDFARLADQVRPRVILGENVRGLLAHDGGRTFSTMRHVLGELGYDISYRVLRAQFYDVPQKRERLVFIAARRDLGLEVVFPQEKDYLITVRDALKETPLSDGMNYTDRKAQVMEMVPEGGNWRDLPEDIQQSYMGKSYFLGGGKTGMARRLAWDEPALTLTCNPAQKQTERCHPEETRPLTVREYARLQTFPDDWTFEGSVTSQYRQIGNAVPVNLGYHIGLALRQTLGAPARNADRPANLIPIMPEGQLPLHLV